LDSYLLNETDQRQLLELARNALEARVRRERCPAAVWVGALALPRAAFVSIHRDGDLRGCLGRLRVDRPLGETVADLAGSVADSDPRFSPLLPSELPFVQIEISVLTPPHPIGSIAEIEVGRHGLIVERGSSRGLLLPQVATERSWTRETFLEQTCIKAGLPRDAWKDGATVLAFEAQVFGESEEWTISAIPS
jgi:AmmeMemoRadiSam system protein A